jgi:uracil-DNA glycosylase family 4
MAVDLKRAMAQLLGALSKAGVTHLPKVRPVPPPTTPRTASRGQSRGSTPDVSRARRLSGLAETDMNTPMQPAQDPDVARICGQTFKSDKKKGEALTELAGIVAQCRRCEELATTRTQTVFGVGNPNAQIMFVGEAPGADEDQQGEPFVGRAGQLMNKIIEACTLTREEIYICNILRCRPPGNRNPSPAEAANCREFLDAQIQIVQPEYIVCWGTIAAQNLLSEKQAVGKLRGQFFDYGSARVLCTYHPSYLLRNPSAKKLVWDDMKFFMKELGVTLE